MSHTCDKDLFVHIYYVWHNIIHTNLNTCQLQFVGVPPVHINYGLHVHVPMWNTM